MAYQMILTHVYFNVYFFRESNLLSVPYQIFRIKLNNNIILRELIARAKVTKFWVPCTS